MFPRKKNTQLTLEQLQLNCRRPLNHGFFSMINTPVLRSMTGWIYGCGIVDTEEQQIGRGGPTMLHRDFPLHLHVFQGQLSRPLLVIMMSNTLFLKVWSIWKETGHLYLFFVWLLGLLVAMSSINTKWTLNKLWSVFISTWKLWGNIRSDNEIYLTKMKILLNPH